MGEQWSAEQLVQLAQLSDELVDVPLTDRDVWLARAKERHPDIGAALDAMANAPILAASPVLPSLTLPFEVESHLPGAGDEVGPFRLIRPLGQGGMSVVWLAEQVDGRVRRRVALKLISAELSHAGWRQRFERERDILAAMSHPGIARIIDADVGEHGLAYLVMDYIDGEDIVQYATSHATTPQTCVQQVIDLLDAVAYAHSNSVIHRDLKPSNVLVDRSGRVVLLDFGIAKLTKNSIETTDNKEGQLTALFGQALTLNYASPEQVAGGPIDERTDVYSAGVLLFELLAGQRPYTLRHRTRSALEEAILEQALKPPSERVVPVWAQRLGLSDHQVAKQLRGALDAIVLKALQPDPTKRYTSANEFAADLRQWLAGQAVPLHDGAPSSKSTRKLTSWETPSQSVIPIFNRLIPSKTALGLALVFASLADLLVPRLLPVAWLLRDVTVGVATLLILAALWPSAIDKLLTRCELFRPTTKECIAAKRRRLVFNHHLLIPIICVAVALTASMSNASMGGLIASHVPSFRPIQQGLLGLTADAQEIANNVNRAPQTQDPMTERKGVVQGPVTADPVSVALLDLQGIGSPAQPGEAWPARLAVYLNAQGYEFAQLQLWMSAGLPGGGVHSENLSSALGRGSGPGAVQVITAVPVDARWVTACLTLPARAGAERHVVLHRWQVKAQRDMLQIQADGQPQILSGNGNACAV